MPIRKPKRKSFSSWFNALTDSYRLKRQLYSAYDHIDLLAGVNQNLYSENIALANEIKLLRSGARLGK